MSSKEEIRARIDKIDSQILKLLSRRAGFAQKVGRLKTICYDPKREREIMRRLFAENKGPLGDEAVRTIYREIIGACRDLQRPLKVAYLGPEATYSNAAAIRKFGSAMQGVPCRDIAGVFDEVEKGNAEYGVVPFENSTEGVINYTLDRFTVTPLKLCGEVYVDVAIYVMSRETNLNKVDRLFVFPKTMGQCSEWLRENAGGKEIIQVSSTGRAAQRAAETENSAALASKLAAGVYGLKIIAEHVEDSRDNKTRFLVVGRCNADRTGHDKTSVIFSVRHAAGSLYRALKSFEKYKINLTMMQARPSRSVQWDYSFFVDIQGHLADENVKKALAEMKKETTVLKIMGSYPEENL